MRIYDVTRPVSPSLPVWPGDPPLVLERMASMERGDRLNLSRMASSVHIGTHVDAPLHFIAGAADASSLSLDVLIGPVRLVELPREFIVPGDSLPGATLDVARTVVRRAERLVVKLMHDGLAANTQIVRYLNRLSSLLFVMARHEDALAGVSTVTLVREV